MTRGTRGRARRRVAAIAAGSVAAVLVGSLAGAVRTPDHLRGRPELEVAEQGPVRAQRTTQWKVPPERAQAWGRFVAAHGRRWRAYWDGETGVPRRIFGAGEPAPGVMTDPAEAERHARRVLTEHIELLAPGASADDLVLASNHLGDGIRSVGFAQHARGMPVLGGQVSVRFKAERMVVIGSEALPDVHVAPVAQVLDESTAKQRALAWMTPMAQHGPPVAGAAEGPMVLPLVRPDATLEYRVVMRVRVDLTAPMSRWDVFVDATTAAPVARRQTLRFANGALRYDTPVRWPGGDRGEHPAVGADITVDGAPATTDSGGAVDWPGDASASVVTSARGPRIVVANAAGDDAHQTLSVEPGSVGVWSAPDDEFVDAQITAFVHADIVQRWAAGLDPDNAFFTADQLVATVNVDGLCNAFSDGTNLTFFRGGGGCSNTARLPDLVYHEYGHSLHEHAILAGVGAFEAALGEGLSDYVAATINDDPAIGIGFFRTEGSLRHLDTPVDLVWPDDIGDAHRTGAIFGGAMWDLRKHLVATYGASEGVARADALFYAAIRRSTDIPSTYVEVLAADDDDGDLANGTPNQCAINEAFSRHGLAAPGADIGPRVSTPVRDAFRVVLPVLDSALCPDAVVGDAVLTWQVRGDVARSGTLAMVAEDGALVADIPPQPLGDVVQYRVELTTDVGDIHAFPLNLADPFYEFFVGTVTPLYCTDFEGAAEPAGWSHDAEDEWQWGAPVGRADDPRRAYSGARIYGTDLGGVGFDGSYQPDQVVRLTLPEVDVADFDTVRLQYRRWLQVEDSAFDQARILANDETMWTNASAGMAAPVHHLDSEWRFHDVDLSSALAGGAVRVAFELSSDGGVAFGGWNLDDVCVVGYRSPRCGNDIVEDGEACDDGNADSDDGCSSDCVIEPARPGADAGPGGGSSADDASCGCRATHAGRVDPWLISLALAFLWRRRRQESSVNSRSLNASATQRHDLP